MSCNDIDQRLPRSCTCDRIGECVPCTKFHCDPRFNCLFGGDGTTHKSCSPGFVRKAINFAQALAKHAASGFKAADPAEQARRFDICQGCPLLVNGECKKCGCAAARKTPWKTSKCPEGKW